MFVMEGYSPDQKLVNALTLILYFMALTMSEYVNFFRKKK